MDKKVFVNRTLNLKKIKYIGLDMDHTLIRYKSENFESLAYSVMISKLVSQKGYPVSLKNLKFDYNRAIRGLVVDKQSGNLLKLSRYGAIRSCYHGLNPIDYKTSKDLYKGYYIDLSDSQYNTIDTTFSISFATLFSQIVDLKDSSEYMNIPDYRRIASDIVEVLDMAHRDGSLKDRVREDVSHFIIKDEATVAGLEKFKKHGKKIVIITNSDFHYSKLLLDYAINPFLKEHDDWSELFEYVITLAQKPRFFFDKLSFLKINPTDGSMVNYDQKLEPGIYQGGCASKFTDDLNISSSDILYIGDHIYGDIVRLKKDCAWRTALVVEELEKEVEGLHESSNVTKEIESLMAKKVPMETKIDMLISKKIESGSEEKSAEVDQLILESQAIDKKISLLIKKQQSHFNQYWGEIMRTGIEESYFAYQVERFADIYFSRLSDFLDMSPRTYFRSHKRVLAHDLDIHQFLD